MNTRIVAANRGGNRHAPASFRGMALIEVLVSILLFSFGVLGLIGLEARSISFSVDAEDRNRASLLANEIASDMWLANSVVLSAAVLTPLNARIADPTAGGLPSGVLVINAVAGTTNSADIVLTWTPPQHSGAGDTPTSSFTTRVILP
ncbi:MAG TPA: type IV pilus modification protein PilV [Steroidobacteraceae bacterium]